MTASHQALDHKLSQLLGFLRQDPNNARLQVDVFDAAMAAGNFTEAGAQVAQALHTNADDVAWLHREASLLLAQGHFQQAEQGLQGRLDRGMDEPVTRYDLAYAWYGLEKYELAGEAAAALKTEPGELGPLAWSLWLRCEHNLRHLDESLKAFRELALGLPSGPSWSDAYGAASLIALDANHMAEAQQWSNRALREDPNQLEALVTKGSLTLGHQKTDEARACFEQALNLHPKDGRSWSGLAFTRFLDLDFRGAQDAFHKSLAFMPTHIGTWIGLGWCEFLSQRTDAALEAFERALALDRNFDESHGALAVALVRLGQRERAASEAELAIRLDPQCLSARYAQALLKGEANDAASFQRFARRVLSQRPDPFQEGGEPGRTLADVVLRRPR